LPLREDTDTNQRCADDHEQRAFHVDTSYRRP
jgi:hypothetical protein